MKFDIFSKLQENITDFDEGGYYIAGEPKSSTGTDKGKKGVKGGYYHSQKELYEAIDMAGASKFKKGIRDIEGQRKTYINIVNFYRDVMKMKIIIKMANYIFEPLSTDFTYPVWLQGRKFGVWGEEESYDDELQDYAHDLATYGSTVSKKLGNEMERVALRTMRNTQSARTLFHAATTGGYVMLEDDKHFNEMDQYPGWATESLAKHKTYNTFEAYMLVPESLYKDEAWKTNGGIVDNVSDSEAWIPCQAILIPAEKEKGSKKITKGKIVWMEKFDEDSFPLEECHAEKMDGRWAGKGEIEKQLENQIGRNLNANLRRRGLLWAVKKVFQSASEDTPSQLLMEVADGEVVRVGGNGQITQVNTTSQNTSEFSQDDEAWKENSQQNSFAFNIATGENMPSGTSFSLGVVLERAVSSHFSAVRNRFSSFLKRNYFNQLLDIFREEYSGEHTQQIPLGATDIENLTEAMITYHVNERMWGSILARKPIDMERLRFEVQEEMQKDPWLFINIPEDFYPNAHYYMKLNIDDDIGPDMETLKTLYQTMVQQGDPRAEQVLKQIFAKQGKSLSRIAGKKPAPVAPINPANPEAPGELPAQDEAPAPITV